MIDYLEEYLSILWRPQTSRTTVYLTVGSPCTYAPSTQSLWYFERRNRS